MHLLVPIDFSDCTHGLVERAADLAARLGGRLTLLHAVEAPAELEGVALEGGRGAGALLADEAAERLGFFSDLAAARGAPVDTAARPGAPGEAILAAADALGADMIMMGTHGRRGVARLVLGSIAEHVIRRASVPVTTLRTQRRPACEAASCAVCATDVTAARRRLRVELEG